MDGERYPLFLHVLNVEPHAIVRAKRHQILNPGILRGQRLLVIAILKDLRHILAKDGARPLRRERERPAALRRITGDRQRSAPRQRGGADQGLAVYGALQSLLRAGCRRFKLRSVSRSSIH